MAYGASGLHLQAPTFKKCLSRVYFGSFLESAFSQFKTRYTSEVEYYSPCQLPSMQLKLIASTVKVRGNQALMFRDRLVCHVRAATRVLENLGRVMAKLS